MTHRTRDLTVAYPAGLGPSGWRGLHAGGEMPDAWLYGLNRLRDPEPLAVEHSELSSSERLALVAKLCRRRSPAPSETIITWEERVATRVIARSPHLPRIVTGVIWDSDADDGSAARRLLTRAVLRRCAALWCLSTGQLDDLNRRFSRHVEMIRYVRFGIDTDFFSTSAGPTAPTLLAIGTDRHRDWDTVTEVYEMVRAARPQTRLLAQAPANVALPDGVERLGWMSHSELRDVYAASTAVVIATRPNLHFSGMTVACESQSIGRPVIGTRTPGADEYVLDGKTGFLHEHGDVSRMVDSAITLLDDPALAERMGRAGREWATEYLTSERMVNEIAALVLEAA